MRNVFKKMKGKMGKVTFALAMALCCLCLGSEVASAYNYYDGGNTSFSTYGASNSSSPSGSQEIASKYMVKILVRRADGNYAANSTFTADAIKNYETGSSHTNWKCANIDGSTNNYSTNCSLCSTLPSYWSDDLHINNEGIVYYTCATCGNPNAFIMNFVQYGYYDVNGKVIFTGFSGFAHCSGCLSEQDTEYVQVGNVAGDEVGTYNKAQMSDGSWQGVYVFPEITNQNELFAFSPDVAYLPEEDKVAGLSEHWEKFRSYNYTAKTNTDVADKTYWESSYIDSTNNGRFIRYTNNTLFKTASGPQSSVALGGLDPYKKDYCYAIKLSSPLSNNAIPTFGYHSYKKYYDYVNFAYWIPHNNGLCIHSPYGDNNFSALFYQEKTIGNGGWGKLNYWGKCLRTYQQGYIGICADCGEEIPALIYGSPETISSLRRFRNGAEYYYFCPYGIGNMTLSNGKKFAYLDSQVENQYTVMHACYAIAANQYTLQFETNSPNASLFANSSYTEGGYFYKVYEDGKAIQYAPETSTIGFRKTIPTISSKNTISNPTWDSKGYIFKNWQVYNATTGQWVNLDATPTWKELVALIGGEESTQLSKDGNKIRLRATWTTPSRTLNIVDGDDIKNGKTVNNATVKASYTVRYQQTQIVSTLGNKSGTVAFNVNRTGVTNPNSIATSAYFSNFEAYSGNKGIFDTSTRTYLNTQTDANADYIIGNYSWNTITLPTPTASNAVFAGWYKEAACTNLVGYGGGPYTPTSANVTLYGKWVTDTMTISANVTDHINGTTKVDWVYNNAAMNTSYFYKIFRDSTLLTGGSSNNGSAVTTTNLGVAEQTTNGSTTIETEGIYTITLKGAAGANATSGTSTATGGKGSTYTVTMHLLAGDKLNWYLASGATNSYSTAYNGTTGGKYGNQDGVFSNGGAASVLVLTRNGSSNVVAVASGGGGAIVLPVTGGYKTINGGNALGTGSLTSHGSTTPQNSYTYYQSTGYNTLVSGGGGGAYHGASGILIAKKHTHTASGTLVSGTALTENAVYNASGGCFTNKKDRFGFTFFNVETFSVAGGNTVTLKIKNPIASYTNVFGVEKQANITAGTNISFTAANDVGWTNHTTVMLVVDHVNGSVVTTRNESCCNPDFDYNSSDHCPHIYPDGQQGTLTQYVYTLSCNEGSGGYGSVAISGTRVYDEAASTGGSCWYNSTYVISATQTANNTSTSGSFKMEATNVGVTSITTLTDTQTDDKAKPNAPGAGNALEFYTVMDGTTVRFYMTNIHWLAAVDKGTNYTFSGETWSLPSTLRASTTNNAVVTVTSGIKQYKWSIKDSAGTVIYSGTTNADSLTVGNQYIASCQYNVVFDNTYTLSVIAVDNAGNESNALTKSVRMRYNPQIVEHQPGILNAPSVEVVTGTGVYRNGTSDTYYVKADGTTKIRLKGTAKLSAVNSSRITQVTLGSSYDVGYIVKTDLINNTVAGTTYGGSIGSLIENGNIASLDVQYTQTIFAQDFVTQSEDTNTITSYAKSDCLGDYNTGCAITAHKYQKAGNSITVVGDKTAPALSIGGSTFSGEKFDNAFEYDWGNNKATFTVTDNGSGIKSIKVVGRSNNSVVLEKTYVTRTTSSGNLSFTVTQNGENIYEVEIEDNVGNITKATITVKVDNDKPSITDITSVTADEVHNQETPIAPKTIGSWSTTNVDTLWEYNWVPSNFTISYLADDSTSQITKFEMYSANANWAKIALVQSGVQYVDTKYKIEQTVNTEGTSRYILEAIDTKGNKTTVYIIVRIDKNLPTATSTSCDAKTNILDGMTIAQANSIVNGNINLDNMSYTWTITWKDSKTAVTTNDTSGMASSTLYIYDKANPTIAKSYPMIDANGKAKTYGGYTYQKSSGKFMSKLKDANGANTLRYESVTFEKKVNTFTEFPTSTELGWRIVGVDNAGNTFSKEGGTINNYAIKAVAYATKDNGYNIASGDGKTNLPYFKTGEVGFVEVWTLGYIDKLELNFGSTSDAVPKVARDEINRGAYLSKYKLGSKTFAETDRRFVTTLAAHKSSNTIADLNGVPFVTHYIYSFDDVNQSLGSSDTSGWESDGTMMRIPPSYELSPKMNGSRPLTDKYGNTLYNWETHEIEVIGYKGTYGTSSKCYYVIWDEAGDDLHYRITHENLLN